MGNMITIQREIESVWTNITGLKLVNGDIVTLGINNDGAERDGCLWVTGYGGAQPSMVGNIQGKEAIEEGWLGIKLVASPAYTTLTFPSSFPLLWTDFGLSENAFPITVAASSRTLFMLKYTIPADVATIGEMRFNLKLRYI